MLISILKRLTTTLFFLLPLQSGLAAERNSIIWLSDGVSIEGTSIVELYPISNVTGESYEHDPSPDINAVIRNALETSGLVVVNKEKGEQPAQLALKTHLVYFAPGSVGGRWIGFGGGSAVCILRTLLIGGSSSDKIGEIIVANQVSSGGLFSAGAETYVCKHAAEQTAENLAALIGVELRSDEGISE